MYCSGPHKKKEFPKYKGNKEGHNNEYSINALLEPSLMMKHLTFGKTSFTIVKTLKTS